MSSSERLVAEVRLVTYAEIFTKQTIINLISYTFLALHSVAYDQVLPVFLNYPSQVPDSHNTHLPFKFSGGFGLSSDRIGSIYTVYGIACGIIQFFLFPPLCKRFGVLNCYRAAALTFPFLYILTPYTALVQDTTLRYGLFMFIMLVKGFVVIVGFPCTTILLTNSASSLHILGTLNGFATAFSGLGRAVGPAMTGAIFSVGVQKGYMIFPWWTLAAVSLVGAIPSWFIIEGDGPSGKPVDDDDDDDDDESSLEVDNPLLSASEREEALAFEGDEVSKHKARQDRKTEASGAEGRRVANLTEQLIFTEPDDPETDSDSCPPLCPELKNTTKTVKTPPQVRLRRMSAAGDVIEGDRRIDTHSEVI